ncbi:MAG: hypothetical protein IMW98_03470 [Firmicutes bacterium]|nr:hypothetical protein [Bacillota bacterium]
MADLVGVREAAGILGWDRRKVSVYVARGKLPPPVARLRSGPVWDRQVIEAFARGEVAPVASGNKADVESRRVELWDLERRIAERRRELADLERRARRMGKTLPSATNLDREVEDLLAVGIRVWSAAMAADATASGGTSRKDDALHRHEFASLALRLGLEQAVVRLLGWRQAVWPPEAREALDDALAALGPEYRVRGGRLEQKRGDKWERVRLA